MKNHTVFRLVGSIAVLAAAIAGGAAQADTGFNGTGGAGKTAGASLNGVINVPHILLLRVGAAEGVTTLTFNPAISVPGGNTSWDGMPLTSTSPTQSVQAFAYTNHPAGASLTCTTTGVGGPLDYLFPTDIGVATTLGPSGVASNTLNHPGLDLSCGATSSYVFRNAVFDANWTYTLPGSIVINYLPGGTLNFSIGYTLTNL